MNIPSSGERYGLEFGSGSFVGKIMDPDNDFFEVSVAEQAFRLGWADGCPIPEQLIASDEVGRGPEAMRQRYAEVNFWFGEIVRQAEVFNPDLHESFIYGLPRYEGRPGNYESQSVPDSHLDRMAAMDTLWGYAAPRVLIEQFKGRPGSSTSKEAAQDRLVKGLEILERVTSESLSPTIFLAKLSEEVTQADADSTAVLHHALSKGKFEEENQPMMWSIMAGTLYDFAPQLWGHYNSLNASQKNIADILDVYDLDFQKAIEKHDTSSET